MKQDVCIVCLVIGFWGAVLADVYQNKLIFFNAPKSPNKRVQNEHAFLTTLSTSLSAERRKLDCFKKNTYRIPCKIDNRCVGVSAFSYFLLTDFVPLKKTISRLYRHLTNWSKIQRINIISTLLMREKKWWHDGPIRRKRNQRKMNCALWGDRGDSKIVE